MGMHCISKIKLLQSHYLVSKHLPDANDEVLFEVLKTVEFSEGRISHSEIITNSKQYLIR